MHLKPILFFLIIGGLAGDFVYRTATNPDKGDVAVGSKAPDFTIKDEGGKEIRLSDYRGKLVFLNFFRADCAPCVEEMPDLDVVNKMFKGRPFQMLIVSGDTEWKTDDDFYKDHHLTSFSSYLDPGWAVYRQYRLTGTPETFLIDGSGSIVKHYIGPAAWTSPPVLSYLDNWVRKQEVAETTSVQ
jgi:peroxiredoxin